ncbi:MAG TPA: Hsp33 family molecular chaperone HslO [Polyangiaceae bacterium]|nr:Hsp33 family molecular chaperone HslO [Polyangiaceae bacterium]
MTEPTDSVLRAITDDGAFRVITARTTNTVRGAIEAQNATGQTARYFGDLLTASILFRETMAPNLRVQGIIKGSGGTGSLVADSHPSGQTRGLIQLKGESKQIELGQGAVLQLMRTLASGRINQGVVEVPQQGGISQSLMAYMQSSEQVFSMLALGTVFDGDQVVSAGGYMVQLLPEVGRGPLMVMTERLRDFETIDLQLASAQFTPTWLLDELLFGMPFTRLEESPVRFECWCDELRVVSALASLSRSDLEHLLSTNEVLEIACEYCKRDFRIAPARLRGLLEQS